MLRRFRQEYNLSEDEKLTYAGRLDPMAEGIVPVLSGEARFQKDQLLASTKTYEVDIILGLGTDTGDLLGMLTEQFSSASSDLAEIEKALAMLAKTVSLPYPNYSSVPVDGKPLFMHARANNKVILPIKKVKIFSLELLGVKEMPLKILLQDAIAIIEKVEGDFRQQEIIGQWMKVIEADGDDNIQIVAIRTTVSSGTYMRSLAEKLGKLLKVPALAGRIVRTEVEKVK